MQETYKQVNAFILVQEGPSKDETPYEKQALDKCIELREFLKKGDRHE